MPVLLKLRSLPPMSSMPSRVMHLDMPRAFVSPGFMADSRGPLMAADAPKVGVENGA